MAEIHEYAPGTFCWVELTTTDATAAKKFYSELFGWGTHVQQMGPTTYTSFMNGERPAGGMMAITEEWGDVPPHWLVYFAVDDCDVVVERAREHGAEIKVPPTDIPDIGRFAVIQDPQGAVFAIIRLENPA
jgi:predicted enzyme related to lactoylglutathione lyase